MIHTVIFTPKGVEFEANLEHIQVTDSYVGSFGILENHAPIVSTVLSGCLITKDEMDEYKFIALTGAVVKFKDNELSIVAEEVAFGTDEIDAKSNLEKSLYSRKEMNKERNIELALAENELKKQIKKTGAGKL
jgi:F0F1-type ATP synthase epsilon subunit